MGDSQEVQHRVGGATGGHDDGHGIFDGLFGHDVARLQIVFHGFHQHTGSFFGAVGRFIMGVGHGAGKGQRHAQRFKRRTHGVGGVHPATRATTRNRTAFDFAEVFLVHIA